MKLACLIVTCLSVYIGNGLSSPEQGFDTFWSTPKAHTVSVSSPPQALNDTHSSFDCRGYKTDLKRPEYVPEDSFLGALCASQIFGVPVEYIVAVQQLECNFGQSSAQDIRNKSKTCRDQGTKNGCSAAGPGQFIPQTWDKRNKNGKCNRKAQELREGNFGQLKEPAKHAGIPGYGMDCDADGIANPWNVLDSACATAHYLSAINAGANGDWFQTFQVYNGGWSPDRSRTIPYSRGVMERANNFIEASK